MLWQPETLSELRECVNAMIDAVGEGALIGHRGRDQAGEFLDTGICFSWVCIRNADLQIVGDEGSDYEMRLDAATEANAIALHCVNPEQHQRREPVG